VLEGQRATVYRQVGEAPKAELETYGTVHPNRPR
jgi:hypothetical protein